MGPGLSFVPLLSESGVDPGTAQARFCVCVSDNEDGLNENPRGPGRRQSGNQRGPVVTSLTSLADRAGWRGFVQVGFVQVGFSPEGEASVSTRRR